MKKFLLILLSAFLLAGMLSACSLGDEVGGTGSGSESGSEGETEIPRLDYFAEDPFSYIEIDKSAYKDLTLTLEEDFAVTDESVKNYIDKTLYSAKKKLNDGNRVTSVALKNGDAAYIFYKGEIDGEAFEGGSNISDTAPLELHLGSDSFIDGFEDGLIGIVPNETSPEKMHAISLKFPEDYTNEELAGKDVVFYVYVVYAVQYEIPEYNEETVLEVLKFQTESDDILAAYEKYVYDLLEAEGKKNRDALTENALWDILLEATTVKSYPQVEIDFYLDAYKSQMQYYYQMYTYYGYEYESFDVFVREYMGLAQGADWEAELTNVCREMVEQNLIYHAIAKLEGIEVSDEEYRAEIKYYVDQNDGEYTEEEIVEEMGEAYIKESALYKKVIHEFLIPSCHIEYEK